MKHVVLTGFMGVGKTAVGRRLARRLGRPFIDTDQLIEDDRGLSIAEIFARYGEEEFRRIERATVAGLAPERPSVIATGGGTFADEGNRERLRALGVVVCLVTSIDTVVERVSRNSRRPLAASGAGAADAREKLKARLTELYESRRNAYGQADILVETDALTVDQSAVRVLNMVQPHLKAEVSRGNPS